MVVLDLRFDYAVFWVVINFGSWLLLRLIVCLDWGVC